MDHLKRLELRLKLNKLTDCNIVGPIILSEKIKGELVQGWIGIPEHGWCWHVWVEKDGNINDVLLKFMNFSDDVKVYYSLTAPEKYEKDDEVVESWKLYNKSPKDFWKTIPNKLKNFRAKYIHS